KKNSPTKQHMRNKDLQELRASVSFYLNNPTPSPVPQVLKACAEFIEEHGVVDGIYRLSGVTSNIQRLRQEFNSEAFPDLRKEVYLQDIHCVGSLCKLYFRELPNPLLTYELYSKFTEVVRVQGEHERLLYIRKVVKELPTPHFRTLEYLTRHLAHLATLSTQTNMHARNLALVWAPNLLRCKDIEVSADNGDMAFQAVRIQQSVVEFILNHTEQIFNLKNVMIHHLNEKHTLSSCRSDCGPMKLMSLEEAQARSLSPNHPVHRERQRENSLPDTSTATLYHTVIDIDSKRKLSGKSKKWRSIFNLGRSVDSKGKLNRNGSVFIRASGIKEKAALRPSRSMESLCSLPTDDDRTGGNSPAGGLFAPDVKSRTLGSDSLYDLTELDQTWEFKGNNTVGASGGWSPSMTQKGTQGASVTPPKTLPEQLKVYKGEDLSSYKPTSPKNRRMLYNSSSRPSFPGSFFPLESSPRHQRRAVNISEPFAVSVPLRVSAVISSNSTPCRGHIKDKAATLKPCKESADQGGSSRKESWSDLHQELKITEPEMEQLDETFKPLFGPKSSCEVVKSRTADVKSKLSRSSPSLSLLFQETSSNPSLSDRVAFTRSDSVTHQPPDSNASISLHKDREISHPADTSGGADKSTSRKRDEPAPNAQLPLVENISDKAMTHLVIEDKPTVLVSSAANDKSKNSEKQKVPPTGRNSCDGSKNDVVPRMEALQRLSLCLEEKHNTLEPPHLDNEEGPGGNPEELDLLEPWEDLSSTKQWVTSPLHSPDVEELFNQLSPFGSQVGTLREETKTPSPAGENNRQPLLKSTEDLSGSISPTSNSNPKTNWTYAPSRGSVNLAQAHPGKCSAPKQKNTLSSQRLYRQMSYEAAAPERREEQFLARHRPYSLNLDSGHRCIRDISNQQNRNLSEPSSCQRGSPSSPGGANNGLPSDLELFLSDRQAPLRRNSAPVSVSSVRTAFMIKTCQAKAVPVVPPRVQYSQIPHSRQDNDVDVVRQQDKDCLKMSAEKSNAGPPAVMSDLQEELENKEPPPKHQKQANVEKCAESARTTSTPELPVITRRHAPSLDVFVDGPRPNRGNILQRPSFRNRQRPQSLILLSPPFPIMDYPPSGDDGKLKSLNDPPAGGVKEAADNYRMAEGIALQNKMTIPKSGQRLETSTSCFYQPQRRSMIFDSRSQRQIE
uniref:Rho GTPase activating protein 31 n=1 Tax=Takifugu rubripes TaxID=31033 RepID=A0A674N6G7_TAKRU